MRPCMTTTNLEPLLREVERRAVLIVLRDHPEWTLGHVFSHLQQNGPAAYLRARVGGPRWKLQASLRRLVNAGLVERSGSTSATRYWIVRAREESRP